MAYETIKLWGTRVFLAFLIFWTTSQVCFATTQISWQGTVTYSNGTNIPSGNWRINITDLNNNTIYNQMFTNAIQTFPNGISGVHEILYIDNLTYNQNYTACFYVSTPSIIEEETKCQPWIPNAGQINGLNASWNQALADTLYYKVGNICNNNGVLEINGSFLSGSNGDTLRQLNVGTSLFNNNTIISVDEFMLTHQDFNQTNDTITFINRIWDVSIITIHASTMNCGVNTTTYITNNITMFNSTSSVINITNNITTYVTNDIINNITNDITVYNNSVNNITNNIITNITNDYGNASWNESYALGIFTNNASALAYINASGWIKNWDPFGYIKDWNASGLILNWSSMVGLGNTSWNQSYADTLYAPIGVNYTVNITNNITTYVNTTNNISNNITFENNITTYVNTTNNITVYNSSVTNVTNNITTYINTTNNITVENNITTYVNTTNNITVTNNITIENNITTYVNTTNNITADLTNYINTTTLDNGSIIRIINSTWVVSTANASGYIKDWNQSGYIVNWSSIIGTGGNLSWNQTYANTLYTTNASALLYVNASGYIVNWNQSGWIKNWNQSGYIINYSSIITTDNTSWNQTYANTLYTTNASALSFVNASGYILNWNQSGYITNWNASGMIINQTAGIIQDNTSWNETKANSIYDSIGNTGGWVNDSLVTSTNLSVGIGNNDPIGMFQVFNGNDYDSYSSPPVEIDGTFNTPFIATGWTENWLLRSEQFPSTWARNNIPIVVADSAISPVGTLVAEVLVGNTSDANAGIQQSVTNATTGNFTFSLWMYNNNTNGVIPVVGINIDSNNQSSAVKNIVLVPGWNRYSVTRLLDNKHATKRVYIVIGSNNVSVWGAQLNPGIYPLQYGAATSTAKKALSTITYIRGQLATLSSISGSSFSGVVYGTIGIFSTNLTVSGNKFDVTNASNDELFCLNGNCYSNFSTFSGNLSWNQVLADSLYLKRTNDNATANYNITGTVYAASFCYQNGTCISAGGGTESDPVWSGEKIDYATNVQVNNNYTVLNGMILSLGNWSNDKPSYISNDSLDNDSIIRNYNTSWITDNQYYTTEYDILSAANASGYIKNWNESGYIKNWNQSGFIINQTMGIVSYNTSWNESRANGLYPSNASALAYVNSSGYVKNWNESGNILNWNQSGYIKDWNASGMIVNQTSGIIQDNTSWNENRANSIYTTNASALTYINTSGYIINWNQSGMIVNQTSGIIQDNTSWNKTYADTIYTTNISALNYINASGYVKNWNDSGYIQNYNASGLIKNWNGSGYIINWSTVIVAGSDNASWNQSYATTLYALISEPVALSVGNWSLDKSSYATNTNVNNNYTDLHNHITSVGNWTLDKTSYSTTLQLDNGSIIRNTNTSWIVSTANASGYIKDWNASGNIQNWNTSGYIKNWDPSGYIKDWNLSGYIRNQTIGIISDNSSWNKSYADTLYTTNASALAYVNASGYILNWNQSGWIKNWDPNSYIKDWNASGYIQNYNTSGLIKNWNQSGYIVNWSTIITSTGDNSSWNQTYANTLYTTNASALLYVNASGYIKDWNQSGYIKNWNASGMIINQTSGIIQDNTSWNEARANTLYVAKNDNITMPSNSWRIGNFTGGNFTGICYNGTDMIISNNASVTC